MMIAGAGLALAFGCALFPWYVFHNQEKFGIRAVKFAGRPSGMTPPSNLAYQPDRLGRPISADEIPVMELDLLPTGTLAAKEDPATGFVPVSEQPFPGEDATPAEYRLVHVANGRAMLEDANGLWIVQTGSLLPDSSRVSLIEKRGGDWVIVTDADRVIPISN